MSTLKLVNLQHQSSNTPALVLDANNLVTVTGNLNVSNSLVVTGNTIHVGSTTFTGDIVPATSFIRNHIINGDMRIDQRYAGVANTPGATAYVIDRWKYGTSTASKITIQQSTVAPPGFSNSAKISVASAYTAAASDYFVLQQIIEGLNISDLAWGTYAAKTVTLSFWVQSSIAGTYFGCLQNSTPDRSYVYTYTINSAGTWEYKTITIPGCTDSSWTTLALDFDLGSGSTWQNAAGSWVSSNKFSNASQVNFVGTAGATFYITGVQLEVGTKATPYELQIYSDQLAQCQRYYFKKNNSGMRMFSSASNGYRQAFICFPVTMRATPTVSNLSATGTGSGTIASFQTTSQVGGAEVNVGNTTDVLDWNTADFAAEL